MDYDLKVGARLFAPLPGTDERIETAPTAGTLREILKVAISLDEENFSSCYIETDAGDTILPEEICTIAAGNSLEDD